jgi:hypothetical protein
MQDGPALVRQYYLKNNTQDGRLYLGTDQAKKLFPEYVANPTDLNEDVSQAAAAVAMAARKTALARPPESGRDWAKIVVGSPATGKTSSIYGGDVREMGITLESIPQDIGYLDRLVDEFMGSGRKVQVDFIFTDDVRKNVQRMVERAKETGAWCRSIIWRTRGCGCRRRLRPSPRSSATVCQSGSSTTPVPGVNKGFILVVRSRWSTVTV